MGRVSVGQLWDTEQYGKVEIIKALPKSHFIGKFLNTGYITKASQAKAFYSGKITDYSVKNSLEDKYGFWRVIKETSPLKQPSGQSKRKVKCRCVCGQVRDITLDTLTRGISTNCGCVSLQNSAHFHGDSSTRLYECWLNMKARCSRRGDLCNYQNNWRTFEPFKEWALSHGYSDNLILLRGTEDNPDIGDYEECNCRWGTKTETTTIGN